MSNISFLAIPNIQGMRLWWYIQLFFIALFFGVCLYFVIYFWYRYRKQKSLSHQLDEFGLHQQDFEKQLLIQKIRKSSDKIKLVLFIEYLERFITTKSYANLSELLSSQWFDSKEIEACEETLYTDKKLNKYLEEKIMTVFSKH